MKLIASIFLMAIAAASSFGQAVPIQNPSFEQLSAAAKQTGPCFDFYSARYGYPAELPPAWNQAGPMPWAVNVLQPFPSNSCGIPMPPDGSRILYLYLTTVYNELAAKPLDGIYVMKFWVANYFTVYPAYYEASIIIGTTDPVTKKIINGHELCSIDGWAAKQFSEISLTCPFPGYLHGYWPDENPGPADPNAHLILSLSHIRGWQPLFDNVSLTFTPTN